MKHPAALLSLLAVLFSTYATRADEGADVQLPDRARFHIYLLVGQSNMAGRGKIETDDREPHERVLMLTKDEHWTPAAAPLHFDKPTIVGVGLGRTFGIEMAADDPDVTIGLVPCAVGGSPIASWAPGAYYKPTESHPYDDAIRRTKRALTDGTLKGILWHQGESDATPELAGAYEAKLHELIARLRKDLDAPNAPFIAGQMGQFAEQPWDDAKRRVDAAHRNLPNKVPNTAFVGSAGLAHKGDEIHFDTPSYHELGRRYAEAYRGLAEK